MLIFKLELYRIKWEVCCYFTVFKILGVEIWQKGLMNSFSMNFICLSEVVKNRFENLALCSDSPFIPCSLLGRQNIIAKELCLFQKYPTKLKQQSTLKSVSVYSGIEFCLTIESNL